MNILYISLLLVSWSSLSLAQLPLAQEDQFLLEMEQVLTTAAASIADDLAKATSNMDSETKINSIYKKLVEVISGKIPTWTEMKMDTMQLMQGVAMNQLTIYGANNTEFYMDAPGLSYDIANLTLYIPYLDIYGEEYVMDNFNLNNLVLLNGRGRMELHLREISMSVKLIVKFRSLQFEVIHVPMFKIGLPEASVSFENLGGEGPSLSNLLNSVFNDALTWIVEALNNDVQASIDIPERWALMEPQFNALFTNVLNTLKASM